MTESQAHLPARILIAEDDPVSRKILEAFLHKWHYDLVIVEDGIAAWSALQRPDAPPLAVLDWMMPGIDGVELCQRIRQTPNLATRYVILLTAKGRPEELLEGLRAGADDYIVKPFDPSELLARIRMILKRTESSLDANPLTHLPGNTSIMEEFQRHIDSNEMFAVGYADLDKFKAYNDVYGFEKGDDIIRETARILIEVVREVGGSDSFVGHIGGDDFVFIMDDKLIDRTSQKIVDCFDEKVSSFYSKKDFEAGYICGTDRQGNEEKLGLLAISIGIVSNATQEITHVAQISEIAAELKKYAKSIDGSNFVRDKRQN